MVALYWPLKRLLTYWFMSDVLPTPESPRMITFSRTFLRCDMVKNCLRPAKRENPPANTPAAARKEEEKM